MLILLRSDISDCDIKNIYKLINGKNLNVHLHRLKENVIFEILGDDSFLESSLLKAQPGVLEVFKSSPEYKLACAGAKKKASVIKLENSEKSVSIGRESFTIIAGPCSIDVFAKKCSISLACLASQLKEAGAEIFRGGICKPRTSPYSFQGPGADGIPPMLAAKKHTGMPVISEIMSETDIELFKEVDMLQVGARNMQNFSLLKALGRQKKPVLLKRGFSNTLDEFLLSAEYILSYGNPNVVLCERGSRSFDPAIKTSLDLSTITILKRKTHLPVIVDPSHATGDSSLVIPVALSAVIAGADGLMIEVHSCPSAALCDGAQALTPAQFADLTDRIRDILPLAYKEK